jgi:hypothetical protein
VVHSVKKKKSGKHGFILKVHFHKAFDFIIWEYLEEVMT